MHPQHAELLGEIRRAAGPPRRGTQHNDSYGGSGHPFYRVPVPARRAIAKTFLARNKAMAAADVLAVVESLFAGESHEEKTLAAIMLGYHAHARSQTGAADINRWLGHLNGWAEIDALCYNTYPAAQLLADWPAWQRLITRLSQSPDANRRRAALVLLAKPVEATDEMRLCTLAIETIDRLQSDPDPLITKAVSWLLRSMVARHRDTVTSYVDNNRTTLPAIAVRETRTKLVTGNKRGQPKT